MTDRRRVASPEEVPALSTLLLAVAVHGFGSGPALPTSPVGDDEFVKLLALAQRDRLLGAVAHAVFDGMFPVTQDQYRSLADMHAQWLRHSLMVERLLLRVAGCFEREGIEFRVIKGAAISRLLYSDPSWRVFGDLDLLIPSDRFDDAVHLATTELGGTQPVPELRPGFDHQFGKEALIRIDGIELDLHRTFVTGAFGLTIDLDRLFDGGTAFRVSGHSFTALSADALFLHCCYNLALGDHPVRLCSLRDLLLARQELDVDLDAVMRLAHDWRATAVLQRAAEIVVEALGRPYAHDLSRLAAISVPRSEAWLLRSYLTSARSYSRPLASLVVIPGIRARLRYALALMSPSEAYLDSRGWTRQRHLRLARDRLIRRG